MTSPAIVPRSRLGLRSFGFWRIVSLAVLLVLFFSVVERAVRQSITIDEAYSWQLFLSQPFARMFTGPFDANNHVLYTAAAWLSIRVFGMNELAVRLPSLVSAVVFFIAVFRIASLLFRKSVFHPIAVIILGANPYILDFFTLGRGYGMSLAFLSMALFRLMAAQETAAHQTNERSPKTAVAIGVYAALAVTANLTFAFPAIAILLVLFGADWSASDIRHASRAGLAFLLPFVIICSGVLLLPLERAHAADFYFGATTWHQALDSMAEPLLSHNPGRSVFSWSPVAVQLQQWLYRSAVEVITGLFVVLLAVNVPFARPRIFTASRMAALILALTVLGLALAHSVAGVKLPVIRTTLDLIFLFSVGLIAAMAQDRWAALIFAPVWLFLIPLFISQWPARAPWEWSDDFPTRTFAAAIESARRQTGDKSIVISGSWIYEPGLNFYRVMKGYSGWTPLTRNDPPGQADFYMLAPGDAKYVRSLKLRVLIEDSFCHALLAAPADTKLPEHWVFNGGEGCRPGTAC